MKMLFLGTSAGEGYPGRWCECENCQYARAHGGRNIRAHSSALLDGRILLDMNDATFDTAARLGVSLRDVGALLITHAHSDHLYTENLYWRKEQMGNDRHPSEMMICANELSMCAVQEFLDRWNDDFHVRLRVTVPGEAFDWEDYSILPIRSIHAAPGYTSNYIVRRDKRTLLYALDTGGYDAEMEAIVFSQKYDAIVMEGTGGLCEDPGEGHMNLKKNAAILRRFQESGCMLPHTKFILTHIAPHNTPPHDQYAVSAAEEGMIVAYDGFETDI